MKQRRSIVLASVALLLAGAGLVSCAEEEPSYETAGERLDAAIQRVERLKRELAEAESELQAARAALDEKVDAAPETVGEIPEEGAAEGGAEFDNDAASDPN